MKTRWIALSFQGEVVKVALAKGYTLAGQKRPIIGNNYPMVDLTNPEAKAYWQPFMISKHSMRS